MSIRPSAVHLFAAPPVGDQAIHEAFCAARLVASRLGVVRLFDVPLCALLPQCPPLILLTTRGTR